MAYFALTDRHRETKQMTGEDMSAHAGMPVLRITQSQFSGWDELRVTGRLSSDAAWKRTKELKAAVYGPGSPFAGMEKDASAFPAREEPFQDNVLYQLAQSRFPRAEKNERRVSVEMDSSEFFDNVIKYGVAAVINPPESQGRRFDFPGMFNRAQTYVEETKRAVAGILLVDDAKSATGEAYWQHRTAIPEKHLSNHPKDGWQNFLDELHELAHLCQLSDGGTLFERGRELHADLFARSVLRQGDVGHETLIGDMHVRYIDLLASLE
ncbi:MAG: hypothetical protein M3N08_10380, partial [Pseudomonadota bacterium]|nr:hypothetical protein [Pseudomonadota bacterium]